MKSASPQADGVARDVHLRAPVGCGPAGSCRNWKLRAPTYDSTDVPVAPQKALRSDRSSNSVGPKFHVSSSDAWESFLFKDSGGAVGEQGVLRISLDAAERAFRWKCVLTGAVSGAWGSRKRRSRMFVPNGPRQTISQFGWPWRAPRRRFNPFRPRRLHGR